MQWNVLEFAKIQQSKFFGIPLCYLLNWPNLTTVNKRQTSLYNIQNGPLFKSLCGLDNDVRSNIHNISIRQAFTIIKGQRDKHVKSHYQKQFLCNLQKFHQYVFFKPRIISLDLIFSTQHVLHVYTIILPLISPCWLQVLGISS